MDAAVDGEVRAAARNRGVATRRSGPAASARATECVRLQPRPHSSRSRAGRRAALESLCAGHMKRSGGGSLASRMTAATSRAGIVTHRSGPESWARRRSEQAPDDRHLTVVALLLVRGQRPDEAAVRGQRGLDRARAGHHRLFSRDVRSAADGAAADATRTTRRSSTTKQVSQPLSSRRAHTSRRRSCGRQVGTSVRTCSRACLAPLCAFERWPSATPVGLAGDVVVDLHEADLWSRDAARGLMSHWESSQ